MKFSTIATWASAASLAAATPLNQEMLEKRDTPGFTTGEPIDSTGKGGPILSKMNDTPMRHKLTMLGGTNHQIDLQNPDNLAAQSTDNGLVVNLKWSFSDSKTKIFNGGWTREQVITDLPSSHDSELHS
jgi:oxalate decarboxylase